jgi:hypothetical protein
MKNRTRITAALLALSVFLALAQSASAREYVVHSCKLPDGRSAPVDGWSPSGWSNYVWFSNDCAAGGAMAAGLGGVSQPGNRSDIGWSFDSGPAAIRSYRIVRSGVPRGWTGGVSMVLFSADQHNNPGEGRVVDYCAAFTGCSGISGVLERSTPKIPENSHGWFFTLGCGGSSTLFCLPAAGATDFGSLRIDSAQFTLDDSDQPMAGTPEGSLTTAGAVAGDIRFEASDKISGVRRATVEVDGRELVSTTPDPAGGRCAELWQSAGPPSFGYRRPCPARTQVELTLPPGAMPTGEHTLRVRVYDAAGNGVTAFGPRSLEIKRGDLSAASAARFLPDGGRRLASAFGRNVLISGSLLANTGEPLPGASIELTDSAAATRRGLRTINLVTDAAGRYAYWIRATASRDLGLRHRPSGAALGQELTVRASIRLRARQGRVVPLGRMVLSGRLQTERTRRGASIAIKVRSNRTWRTVGLARSDTRGRFTFRYRFRRTRHARFTFRAVAIRSGDLAVSPRPSNRVRVRVG